MCRGAAPHTACNAIAPSKVTRRMLPFCVIAPAPTTPAGGLLLAARGFHITEHNA
jgi:hypothetical protein